MNNNRLVIAVVVLLGLSGAVAAAMRSREPATTLEKPSVSLPQIKKDEVTSLEISHPKHGSVSLAKVDGKWSVTAPLSAKADESAVESLLEKLAELEVVGVTASRKENHARLEIDAAQGIRVKAKAGEKQLIDLYVGSSKSGGTLVRLEGQDSVLRVKGSLRSTFDKELKMFRDRTITDIDSKELAGISISSPKGTFKFSRTAEDGSQWTQVLAKGEKPIERLSHAKVQSLSSTFGRLRAADFAPPGEPPETAGLVPPTATVVLTKHDGNKATLELGKPQDGSGEVALRLLGNAEIFRISKYNADRFAVDASAFQEPEKTAGAPVEDTADMPGMAGGGGVDIPPEVLKQLQQQLGPHAMPGGHPH